jgi:hypothetical protein
VTITVVAAAPAPVVSLPTLTVRSIAALIGLLAIAGIRLRRKDF